MVNQSGLAGRRSIFPGEGVTNHIDPGRRCPVAPGPTAHTKVRVMGTGVPKVEQQSLSVDYEFHPA